MTVFLPPEIWEHIFRFIKTYEEFPLALVCSEWYAILKYKRIRRGEARWKTWHKVACASGLMMEWAIENGYTMHRTTNAFVALTGDLTFFKHMIYLFKKRVEQINLKSLTRLIAPFMLKFDIVNRYIRRLHATNFILQHHINQDILVHQFGNIIIKIIPDITTYTNNKVTMCNHILIFRVLTRDYDGIPTSLSPIVKYKTPQKCGRIWCHTDCLSEVRCCDSPQDIVSSINLLPDCTSGRRFDDNNYIPWEFQSYAGRCELLSAITSANHLTLIFQLDDVLGLRPQCPPNLRQLEIDI